jgi:hypothetical protein
MRPIRREGSGKGLSVITLMLVMRNKRVRKVMEKWEPLIKALKR